MPLKFISPAAPPDTPYPMIPREDTKSPGTCSVSIGSSEGVLACSICLRSMTETVAESCAASVSLRVPVTTTSSKERSFGALPVSICAAANGEYSIPPASRDMANGLFMSF